MRLSLEKNVIAGLIVVFLVLITNAVLSNQATNTLAINEKWVTHSHEVQTQLEATLLTLTEAEKGVWGYVITGNKLYLESYRQAVAEVDPKLNRLDQLMADNSRQQQRTAILRESMRRSLDLMADTVGRVQRGGLAAGQAVVKTYRSEQIMKEIRRIMAEMRQEEDSLLKTRDAKSQESHRDARMSLAISTLTSVALVVLLGLVLMRGLSERRRNEAAIDEQRDTRQHAEEELRVSEEFNRGILESAPDCIITLNLDGHLLSINTPGARLMEINDFGPFEGAYWLDFWRGADREAAIAAVETAKTGHMGRFQGFSPTVKETPKWWDVIVAPIRNPQGKVVKLLATSRDITALHEVEAERQRIEQERTRLLKFEQRARAQAEETNRIKDEFLATVSHELRTPLNAILGWANLLRGGEMDEAETNRAFETIERNASAQSRLIEDLLDVSRIITGKLRLERQSVDLASVIEAALEAAAPAAEGKQITVESNLDSQGVEVFADPQRLQQIVWNLLSNAVKFTPRGGRVVVELSARESQIEISVSDTGQGIGPDFLPYVFDRFRQAEGSTSRKHGGLGLGLAIVRHLVELHGGKVTADSLGEGCGATFTVNLPIPPAWIKASLTPKAVATEDEDDYQLLAHAPSLEGLRVLVVDDEPDARDLLAVVLRQRGATVTTADSANVALETLSAHPFDILISDIQMPGVDGYELIRRLRKSEVERGKFIPAVALTAHVRPKDRARVLAAGFQMHVSKPVSAAELVIGVGSLAGNLGRKLN